MIVAMKDSKQKAAAAEEGAPKKILISAVELADFEG